MKLGTIPTDFHLVAEDYENYEVYTEDGVKKVHIGVYVYCAGCDILCYDGDKTWRQVEEDMTLSMADVLGLIQKGENLYGTEEYESRDTDYISDLTEEEARAVFREMLDTYPYLDMKDLTMDTPDGTYFGHVL